MLVLSRRKGERIILPLSKATLDRLVEMHTAGESTTIVIAVVENRGDKSRIGIEAPEICPVHREEVWRKIKDRTS